MSKSENFKKRSEKSDFFLKRPSAHPILPGAQLTPIAYTLSSSHSLIRIYVIKDNSLHISSKPTKKVKREMAYITVV